MTFPPPRVLLIATTVVSLLAAGASLWLWSPLWPPLWLQGRVSPYQGATTSAVQIGGPFDLIDQNGTPRSDADFHGQYMLVQFGYTTCPDVCSIALDTMSRALDTLAERDPAKAARVAPIFISVDPARDTVAALKGYAANFHPRLVALTGTHEQIERVAAAYRVYFAKAVEEPTDAAEHADGEPHDHGSHAHGDRGHGDQGHGDQSQNAAAETGYLINHSTVMYLMGPEGGYLAHFGYGSDFDDIARTLAQQIGN